MTGTLTEAEEARFRAMSTGDVAALEALLHPKLTYIHMNGAAESKDEFLGALREGRRRYVSLEQQAVDRQEWESHALVLGVVEALIEAKGETKRHRFRYSSYYLRETGGWQLLCWQATRIL